MVLLLPGGSPSRETLLLLSEGAVGLPPAVGPERAVPGGPRERRRDVHGERAVEVERDGEAVAGGELDLALAVERERAGGRLERPGPPGREHLELRDADLADEARRDRRGHRHAGARRARRREAEVEAVRLVAPHGVEQPGHRREADR